MAIGKLIIYSAVVDLSTWGECRHIEPVLSPVKSFRPVGMLCLYGQVTTEDETKVQGHASLVSNDWVWPGLCVRAFTRLNVYILSRLSSFCCLSRNAWILFRPEVEYALILKFHFFQGKCKHLCLRVKHYNIIYRVLLSSTILAGTCTCIYIIDWQLDYFNIF